jgi:hypothetical protein
MTGRVLLLAAAAFLGIPSLVRIAACIFTQHRDFREVAVDIMMVCLAAMVSIPPVVALAGGRLRVKSKAFILIGGLGAIVIGMDLTVCVVSGKCDMSFFASRGFVLFAMLVAVFVVPRFRHVR